MPSEIDKKLEKRTIPRKIYKNLPHSLRNRNCFGVSGEHSGACGGRAGARKGLTDRGKTETVLKSDTKKEGGN